MAWKYSLFIQRASLANCEKLEMDYFLAKNKTGFDALQCFNVQIDQAT